MYYCSTGEHAPQSAWRMLQNHLRLSDSRYILVICHPWRRQIWKSLENKPCNTLETLGRALFSTSPWHYQISCPKPHKTSELCMWGGGWGGGRRGFSMTWGSLRAPQQAASNTRDKTRLWWIHQLYIGHVWDAVTIWRRLHRFPSIFQHQSGQTWLSGFVDFF